MHHANTNFLCCKCICDHLDTEIVYYVCKMDECKLIDLFNLFGLSLKIIYMIWFKGFVVWFRFEFDIYEQNQTEPYPIIKYNPIK